MADSENTPDNGELAPLEELTTPLEIAAPKFLPPDSTLTTPEGCEFRVGSLVWSEGEQRCYEGFQDSDGRSVWIREAWAEGGVNALRSEAEVITSITTRMIPQKLALWESDDQAYLVTDIRPGSTIEEAWASGTLTFPQTLSALTQTAYALARLHAAGWVHLGLRPSVIVPGKPASITRFNDCVRIGEKARRTFFYSGYSPPEVFTGQPANPKADIYGIGALLFHAANRTPLVETGAELSTFSPPTPVGGVPQILHRCLGEPETRYLSMDELHQDLLQLLRRCTPHLRYDIVSATDIGLEPTRTTNQDACGFLTSKTEGEEGPLTWAVLCLADGMGGMESGEVASQTAVRSLLRLAATNAHVVHDSQQRCSDLKRWISVANEEVCSALDHRHARGGTTIVCAFLWERELISAHVGDSRLYLIRGGKAEILTRDHSLAMGLVVQGEITLDEIRHHPDRNRVTRSLGERIPLPEYYADSLQVFTGSSTMLLESGDLLMLCSDGLWEPVTDDEIAFAVTEGGDLTIIARRLLDLALGRGGPDNATVVLLRVVEERSGSEVER